MLFSFTSSKDQNANKAFQLGGKYFNIFLGQDQFIELSLKNGDIILFYGDLYYFKGQNKEPIKIVNNYKKIAALLDTADFNPWKIKETLEGNYICIYYNLKEKSIRVFGDYLNRLNLFYTIQNKNVLASLYLAQSFIDKAGSDINEYALSSILCIDYCIDEDTVLKDIKRLGFNQVLCFSSMGYKLDSNNIAQDILSYGNGHLKEYEAILMNSVTKRMSDTTNVVSFSGGWDSTLLVDILCEHSSPQSVIALCWDVSLRNGTKFNIYELNKVKKLCKYYNIKLVLLPLDANSKDFSDSYISYLEGMRKHHLFGLAQKWFLTGSIVRSEFGQNSVVFNGEGCDSLHNFGFSQYNSIDVHHNDLAEYFDKMKSYLYGPTFLKKLIDNNYSDDFCYKFFKWHYDLNNIKDSYSEISERIFHYLYSFIYASKRIPLTTFKRDLFKKHEYDKSYVPSLRSHLKEEIKSINPSNIYSILIKLYCRYWLKSTNIMGVTCSLRDSGLRAAMPYLDTQLIKFLERMPESWGRGLEMNRVKYPLKKIIEKRHKFPSDLICDWPHSYIEEVDPSINLWYEFICNSTLTEYFKEILSDRSKIAFLDQPLLNYANIKKTINSFLSNRLEHKEIDLLKNIAYVTSILNGRK